MKHTLDEGVIRAHVGEPIEITVTGAGTTGYLWQVDTEHDKVRILRHQVNPNHESFGGMGEESFVLEPLRAGDSQVTFRLQRPWDGNTAEEHTLRLTSE
ncbi:MAG TPA: protease inhibitor I42 family protein [Bryobacteraceae bacterium]|nr:protease inhibitor I42 family protein [Bryobacteraceae bacterium]